MQGLYTSVDCDIDKSHGLSGTPYFMAPEVRSTVTFMAPEARSAVHADGLCGRTVRTHRADSPCVDASCVDAPMHRASMHRADAPWWYRS